MWETIAALTLIPILLALFSAALFRSCSRSKARVAAWAAERGLHLSRCEWRCRGGELVLLLRVVDREGRTRDGWVRCGGPLIGMLSRRVEVRWTRFAHNVPVREGS